MKILILTNVGAGLYSFRKELLERIVQEGHTLYVSFSDDPYRKMIENIGCQYIETTVDRRGINPLKDISLFRKYRKLLKTLQPDIVLTYTIKPNVYGGVACQLAKIPYISTVTGMRAAFEKKGLLRFIAASLCRIGQKRVRALFFQNERDMELFRCLKIGRNYHKIAGSGVNLAQHSFEPYPEEGTSIKITFVGRIMKIKGIEELLAMAQGIKDKYPDVEINLIGAYDDDYVAAVESAQKAGYIRYLGPQKDMHPFYKESWAVLMPSHLEGMSNVCLEAAATGRVVLASKIPGCIETFEEGVSGLGFEVENAVSLQHTVEAFLDIPYAQKAAMGAAGRLKMEREFDRKPIVNAYMNELKKVERNYEKAI